MAVQRGSASSAHFRPGPPRKRALLPPRADRRPDVKLISTGRAAHTQLNTTDVIPLRARTDMTTGIRLQQRHPRPLPPALKGTGNPKLQQSACRATETERLRNPTFKTNIFPRKKKTFASVIQAFPERKGAALARTTQILSLLSRHLALLVSDMAEKCKHAPERDKFGVKPPAVSGLWLGGRGNLRKPPPLCPPKPQWRGGSSGNVTTEPGQGTSLQCPH